MQYKNKTQNDRSVCLSRIVGLWQRSKFNSIHRVIAGHARWKISLIELCRYCWLLLFPLVGTHFEFLGEGKYLLSDINFVRDLIEFICGESLKELI